MKATLVRGRVLNEMEARCGPDLVKAACADPDAFQRACNARIAELEATGA